MMQEFGAGLGHDQSPRDPSNDSGYQPQVEDLKELDVSHLGLGKFERVVQYKSPVSQVNIIVAIHNSVLGPAAGGFRVVEYKSQDEALLDVCRLARGMTYKAALADTGTGGGKMVAFAPEGFDSWKKDDPKRLEYMREVGRAIELINRTGPRYFTAEDMGVKEWDIKEIGTQTKFCIGRPEISENPSPYTALGIKASLVAVIKSHPVLAAKCPQIANTNLRELDIENVNLQGISIAVQGALGAVASPFVSWLAKCGANIILADKDEHRATLADVVQRELRQLQRFPEQSFEIEGSARIHASECDVYAPCARGGSLNDHTVEELKCKAVVGCANNQIAGRDGGRNVIERLDQQEIWYAPDFMVNAGGIINAAAEINRNTLEVDPSAYNRERVVQRVIGIMHKVYRLFERAKVAPDSVKLKQPTSVIAEHMAEELIAEELRAKASAGEISFDEVRGPSPTQN